MMLFQYYGGYFGNVGYLLQQFGVFDVILPFMLVFAIVYAALQQTKIFSETVKENNAEVKKPLKNINMTVALVIAASFIAPHIGAGPVNFYTRTLGVDPVVVINQAIPHVGILAVAVTLMLILTGLLGFEGFGAADATVKTGAVVIASLLVAAIFMYSLGWFQSPWLWFFSDPFLVPIVVILLGFGVLIYFITK